MRTAVVIIVSLSFIAIGLLYQDSLTVTDRILSVTAIGYFLLDQAKNQEEKNKEGKP